MFKGLAASRGIAVGRARVLATSSQLDTLVKGEILVCEITTPDWHAAFSKAAAIVAHSGGTLSHSAIVSRERGIPCVVGANDLRGKVKTGDKIMVNGSTGEIRIGDDASGQSITDKMREDEEMAEYRRRNALEGHVA